jgi:hypothetical protein
VVGEAVVVGEAGGVECEVFFPRGMYWYVDHCTCMSITLLVCSTGM